MAAFWSRLAAGGRSCYTFHFTSTQLRIRDSGRPAETNDEAYSDKQKEMSKTDGDIHRKKQKKSDISE